MTSRTFKHRLLAVVLASMAAVTLCRAQENQMGVLLGESLSKLRQDAGPEAVLNCVAELKRIDAMFPVSALPHYHIALQSLNFAVMNPHAEQTEGLIAEAEEAIRKMEQIKDADQSDLLTLKGFLYMVRIVQDPAQNGRRYYLDVMEYYEKALKIKPENRIARQLQEKFLEGMARR